MKWTIRDSWSRLRARLANWWSRLLARIGFALFGKWQ